MVSDRRQSVARIVWTVLFVAGVAAIPVLNRRTLATAPSAADEPGRFGFHLQEVARDVGVDFVHQAPTFDPQLGHIMPQVASTGASVAVADFDRDGWQDFYLTNSAENSHNRLYRNNGDGRFTDVAVQLGVADVNRTGTGVSMGAVWGDYDNDGYEDLLVYKYGGPLLFHNDGGKGFTDVSARAGLPKWVNANSATWLDFDRDGRLDLFIAGYWADGVNLWRLETTRIMPESFEYANNGGRKYLLRNGGDGTFDGRHRGHGHHQPALDAGRGGGRPARHRLSGSVLRQRLRGVGAVRQPGRQAFRGRRPRRPASGARRRAA